MATHTRFFAMALSYKKTGEPRADVVMKAHSEQNAASLASHMASEGGGSLAFSYEGDLSSARPGDATILARFGVVPDDRTLFRRFDGFGKPGQAGVSDPAGDSPTTKSSRASRLASLLTAIWPLAQEREPRGWKGRRLSLAIAWMVALVAASSSSTLLVISARAAQREARLVEMARPACDHAGITNRELHHLVRSEYGSKITKKDALNAVVERCMSKRQAFGVALDPKNKSA
jgi:hypothetical protein